MSYKQTLEAMESKSTAALRERLLIVQDRSRNQMIRNSELQKEIEKLQKENEDLKTQIEGMTLNHRRITVERDVYRDLILDLAR